MPTTTFTRLSSGAVLMVNEGKTESLPGNCRLKIVYPNRIHVVYDREVVADFPITNTIVSNGAILSGTAEEIVEDLATDIFFLARVVVVDVKSFGATGDGTTDDTLAFQSWLTDLGTDKTGIVPYGTYKITDTLELPSRAAGFEPGVTIFWQNVKISSTVQNGAVIQMGTDAQCLGRLHIDCTDQTGSIGVLFPPDTKNASFERLTVHNAENSVVFRSSAGLGCYYNVIENLHSRYSNSHAVIFESGGATNETNANYINFASIQNSVADAIRVNGGDGNAIGYLEAESNTGWAINLLDAKAFTVNAGWLEGNTAGQVSIADYPTVAGVIDILTQSDGTLSGTVSHTYSDSRSVRIGRGNDKNYNLGVVGFSALNVGANAAAAADQDILGTRLKVAAGMQVYRRSSSEKYFSFFGDASDTGYRFFADSGTTQLMTFNSTNGLSILGGALRSLSGGMDVFAQGTNTNIRLFPTGTGKVTFNTASGVGFTGGAVVRDGTGTPEGVVTAPVGSLFLRTDGGAGTTLYVKESGSGNTGWVAK
jgi:hypothetical protein